MPASRTAVQERQADCEHPRQGREAEETMKDIPSATA